MKKHAWWVVALVVIVALFLIYKGGEQPQPEEKTLIGQDAAARTQTAEKTGSTYNTLLNNVICDFETQNVQFEIYNPTDKELEINPKFRTEDSLKIVWNSAKGGILTNSAELCGSNMIGPKQTLKCVGYLGMINKAELLEATGSAPKPNVLKVFTPEGDQSVNVFCS
ncbi:hypothetical protein HYT58_01910, partial [Candidatus Woesearchaeota archaeon]|nr:hypothetical protein [Candidatus Woesearchaeota archaeon]